MRQIPLQRKVGGANRHPETLRFETVAHAQVDDNMYDYLSQWRWGCLKTVTGNEYAVRVEHPIVNGKTRTVPILMHSVVAGFKKTDHIDRHGLNNQRANLRPATNQQNQMNRRLGKDSTSGLKGVSWNKKAGKWQAQIWKDGVKYHLGYFTDKY